MQDSPTEAVEKLLAGDRAALARAITLIESTRPDHREQAAALLEQLLPHTGKSVRLGITGVPGVGKSTLIESLGLHAIAQGKKVAVLAIDPSSARTGGSIMGDKTRMANLSQHENAYIRPSPTAGSLGGVARRTREAMLLTEAAGYDVIIVETVGVGQSETEVADMVDMFLLLLLPGSGDELQGIKRGIMELADLVVVNKADGDMLAQAKRVQSDYIAALRMLHGRHTGWQPEALLCSGLSGDGVPALWESVLRFREAMQKNGEWDRNRHEQSVAWMWKEIRETLLDRFRGQPEVAAALEATQRRVASGQQSATSGAQQLLTMFLGK